MAAEGVKVRSWIRWQQAWKNKLDVKYILDGESTGPRIYLATKHERRKKDKDNFYFLPEYHMSLFQV